ncbi:hypothetical protein [Cochleicola gelatinilyticus]|uniref:Uncharacterized protein n=1 Tax=Cochleicola gelatinilyticus TaxID=1763537 RepID=A0A167HPQ0_9FLAO|nr:hypothetical protein [Cochleicola gelatinilyticus]OAB78833.1 hypothetical protein ULVI_09640 [Cochleicola gelatinilyticus]
MKLTITFLLLFPILCMAQNKSKISDAKEDKSQRNSNTISVNTNSPTSSDTNIVTLEISGILDSKDVIITGPIGWETNINEFRQGADRVMRVKGGTTMELPFIFETSNPDNIRAIQKWYAMKDTRQKPTPKNMVISVANSNGKIITNYKLFSYIPTQIRTKNEGRTSFTFESSKEPDLKLAVDIPDDFGSASLYSSTKNKLVEISGVTHSNFKPVVEIDYSEKIITLEMSIREGKGLTTFVKNSANGISDQRVMKISQLSRNGAQVVSSESFTEILPFKYELFFESDLSIKARTSFRYVDKK